MSGLRKHIATLGGKEILCVFYIDIYGKYMTLYLEYQIFLAVPRSAFAN